MLRERKTGPSTVDANSRLQTARNSTRTAGPQNAEAIVIEFGAAADFYRTAAAKVKTDPRALDESAIRKLLADYRRRPTARWTPDACGDSSRPSLISPGI